MQIICNAERAFFSDNLPCNFVWDPQILSKLSEHIKGYYNSIEKERAIKKEEITTISFNEAQLDKFPSLLLYEKNEMVNMMTSRFAEWGRRAKENAKMKPSVTRNVEDELAMYYMDYEGEDEKSVQEDLRNIEGSNVSLVGGISKSRSPQNSQSSLKADKSDVGTCQICFKIEVICQCGASRSKGSFEEGKNSTEKIRITFVEEVVNKESNYEAIEALERVCYQYTKQPPSLKEIQESQMLRCTEATHQQYIFYMRELVINIGRFLT